MLLMPLYFINYLANKYICIYINLKRCIVYKIGWKTHDEITSESREKTIRGKEETAENINFAWKNQVVGRYNVSRQDYTPAGFEW